MFNMFYSPGVNRLGIKIEDLDEGDGVRITNVEEKSNAEKSGLNKDDIITEIEGEIIKNVNDARINFRSLKEKTNYTIKVRRNGAETSIVVKMPKKKNSANL